MRRALSLVVALVALAACSADESLTPKALVLPDAGATDAGPDAMPTTTIDAGTVKRTIASRSLMGDVPNDYLLDGDFELSASVSPQSLTGWRAFATPSGAPALLITETGGLCRTGLRCAVLHAGELFLGRGASAGAKTNVAAIYAKPTAGGCAAITPSLVSCADLQTMFPLTPSAAPDADGWCKYTGRLAPTIHSVCVLVGSTLNGKDTALVDSARLGPDDGTVNPESAVTWVPTGEMTEALAHVREELQRGAPPPRRARREVP